MGSDLKYLVFSRCLWRGRVPHLKYLYLYLYLLLYLYLWRGKCPTAPSEIFVIVFVFVARKSAPSEMMILNVSFVYQIVHIWFIFVLVTNPWVARKLGK